MLKFHTFLILFIIPKDIIVFQKQMSLAHFLKNCFFMTGIAKKPTPLPQKFLKI